ncbi:MAG: hypothetical protein AAB389_03765 [Patescibacteria group bacterium]|mgnify:FL=1
MKYYAYTIIAAVTATIVAGFFIVGSPNYARLLQQDSQRVSDLQMIQSEILNFWINKARLPKTLVELNDDIRGFHVPQDPTTGETYTYQTTGTQSFKLCAVFAKPALGSSVSDLNGSIKPMPPARYPTYYGQESWQHTEGNVCFDRKIDKELYPPIKTAK